MTKEEAANNYSEFDTDVYTSHVDAFIAGWDAHEQNQWIKVEDGVENGTEAFVYNGKEYSIGTYNVEYNGWYNGSGQLVLFNVTHYKIPKPPDV